LRTRSSRAMRALQEALEEQLKRSARIDSDVVKVGASTVASGFSAVAPASATSVPVPASASGGPFLQASAGQVHEAAWGSTTFGATQTQKKKKQQS
jgi:hypothetical protein